MADLAVEYVDVGAVTLDPANARAHSPKNLETIKGSLRRFGQQKPIVVSGDGVVVAGNGTLTAARELGWTRVAVVYTELSGAELAAYGIADNRSGELAEWDLDALAETLGGLQLDGVDLAEIGFDEADLADLLGESWGQSDDGEVGDGDEVDDAEAIVDPVTKLGDVWLLGANRLVCGDSTDAAVVKLATAGSDAHMLWTDPPYGVSYNGGSRPRTPINNDALGDDELHRFLVDALGNAAEHLTAGTAFYLCSPPGPPETTFRLALADVPLQHRQTIAWVKNNATFGPMGQDYHWRHETILYGHRKGSAHRWEGDRKQDTVWEVDRPAKSEEHPTMKPVALVALAVKNSTTRGDLILDVFGGSGSTLIAAHDLGRTAALVELDPRYCDVICRRWQTFTDEMPVLEATGEPHDFGLYDAKQAA